MPPTQVLRLPLIPLGLGLTLIDEPLGVVVIQLPDSPLPLRLVLQLAIVGDGAVRLNRALRLLRLHLLVLTLLQQFQLPFLLLMGSPEYLKKQNNFSNNLQLLYPNSFPREARQF